jgi:hypothetical protein
MQSSVLKVRRLSGIVACCTKTGPKAIDC